ncbi:MAG: polysulfide reductase [Ignavibacteria bacterium GWB2_35_6b]|nr:MAG: polysulfide reductase [Ignavibacteria bacterium GWB2_35_6b]
MINKLLPKITFWRVVGVAISVFGIYSIIERFVFGLGAVSNLSDEFPWGLWIGFDVVCGVGLAAGGFTISAVAHIFHIKKYEPLTRPAILTAFLGYAFVALGLIVDLGRWYNIWHPLIMWNPSSVMFEVAWCVMLYLTVLFLEFASYALEKFHWNKVLKLIRKALIPIYILGIILSTLHQSSLGSLFLILPTKMYPLWYSQYLPYYFYFSAISVGFAMIIFESYMSSRAFGHGLKFSLLSEISKITMVFLSIILFVRIFELVVTDKINYLFIPATETYMYYLEIIVGFIVPIFLLSNKELRTSRKWLYIASVFVIAGFMLNRINVSITSIQRSSGVDYFPSAQEIGISIFIVTVGVWVFKLVSHYFPVFEHEVEETENSLAAERSAEGILVNK